MHRPSSARNSKIQIDVTTGLPFVVNQSQNYAIERTVFQDQTKLKRAKQRAQEYKSQAEEAKRELIKERARNALLQKQLAQVAHRESDKRLSEVQDELAELAKCFEKSEMIRKQQKILISKMKLQMEELELQNEELLKTAAAKPKKKKKTTTSTK